MIRAQRLDAQHLTNPRLAPAEVVAAFGAMQAQEYAMAKWAIGLRAPGTTDADIEQLVDTGAILRTHPLRFTHHFVAPADIRWLIALLGPRTIARAAPRWRVLELDAKTIAKSQRVLAKALEGGKHLVRAEVGALLKRHRIAPDGQRLPHIIGRAELDGLICSGPRRGNQITIALIDERAPRTRTWTREESLAELAKRYFTTRGPATLQDFIWWSGLPAADAREAMALNELESDGPRYWRGDRGSRLPARAYLIPSYDEYAVAYRDRGAIGTPPKHARNFGETTLLGPGIVIGGEVVGSWSRTFASSGVRVELRTWRKLTPRESGSVARATETYTAFVGSGPAKGRGWRRRLAGVRRDATEVDPR
jgi:hypothetical protein